MKSQGGYIRAKDIKDNRPMYDQLLAEVAKGNVVRLRNGIYALPDEMAKTMIDVERFVPGGILCMYSAWAYYELTTKLPPDICIAIEKKRKVILPDYPPISLYYWSQSALEIGVTKQEIDGYNVRIYDLEKSVCDAVKFRNKIGIDISSEILKNYLKRTDRNLTRLNEYAKRMRVANTMNNLIDYLV
jgi:predicted transcriptional regulator of viral defense system